MQMLADMVIVNESRVGHSRVMQTFNKPRAYSLTLPMRFQVQRAASHSALCTAAVPAHPEHLPVLEACFCRAGSRHCCMQQHTAHLLLLMHAHAVHSQYVPSRCRTSPRWTR